jgi:hypothetical protein
MSKFVLNYQPGGVGRYELDGSRPAEAKLAAGAAGKRVHQDAMYLEQAEQWDPEPEPLTATQVARIERSDKLAAQREAAAKAKRAVRGLK